MDSPCGDIIWLYGCLLSSLGNKPRLSVSILASPIFPKILLIFKLVLNYLTRSSGGGGGGRVLFVFNPVVSYEALLSRFLSKISFSF